MAHIATNSSSCTIRSMWRTGDGKSWRFCFLCSLWLFSWCSTPIKRPTIALNASTASDTFATLHSSTPSKREIATLKPGSVLVQSRSTRIWSLKRKKKSKLSGFYWKVKNDRPERPWWSQLRAKSTVNWNGHTGKRKSRYCRSIAWGMNKWKRRSSSFRPSSRSTKEKYRSLKKMCSD